MLSMAAAGEHRSRFHCLPLARIVAASVVALAFAATVVVVVLTAGLGPDNVRLSVTHGHIQSAGLLWLKVDFPIEHLWRHHNDTITFYEPAHDLTLWVSMDAHDPTRRAIDVCVTGIHVLDMPHAPSFDGMVDIANVTNTIATGSVYKPCALWRHKQWPSMQLDRWVTFNDPLMLCYLSQKYGGINDFTVMLKVDMAILSTEGEALAVSDHTETHYCWPVTIGHTRSIRSEAVTCKPSHAIDYAADAHVLSPCDLTPRQRRTCNVSCTSPISQVPEF